ncbi:MAG: hypothetical protein U9Q82_04115, partial [Chloroflexota bacterium]|nr:hypothetical protein [Chloroflexota bacterium]
MTITTIAPLSAVWVGITAAIILISRDWRVSISALGAQYVGIFILVAVVWPLEYAVIKLVAGWIAAAVLGMGLMERPDAWKQETGYGLSAVLFRVFIAGFVVLVVLSIAPDVSNWILSATRNQILGALFLIGLGLLHLGLTSQPMRVILGLLT